MTPEDKIKILNPSCTSARHASSYLGVSIVYFLKCRCSLSVKLYRKKEKLFSDPHMTPRDNVKIPKPYCTSTGHIQSYPRVSFVYSWKCRQSYNDNNFTKTSFSGPKLNPRAKTKILKPYCESARHTNKNIGYDL